MSKIKVVFWLFMPLLIIMSTFLTACSEDSQLNSMLHESWSYYKNKFIQADGRVIDLSADQITTSEGQSYGLLRSVWTNEPELFAKIYQWTNDNLKKRQDHLFAWKWGKDIDGNWKIISNSAATDADVDIALALFMAYEKWGTPEYLQDAMTLIHDIWNYETVEINGKRYLSPGDWAPQKQKMRLNPSYFAPYAYRLFAQYDKEHDWMQLVNSSYEVIEKNIAQIDTKLVSDWVWIDKDTGEIIVAKNINDSSSSYSYDAIRTYWRLALDYYINGEQRAKKIVEASQFLNKFWQDNKKIPESVSIRGETALFEDSYAAYGTYLPALYYVQTKSAQEMVNEKFMKGFLQGYWGNPDNYYSQNWAWFGLFLYINLKKDPKNSLASLTF